MGEPRLATQMTVSSVMPLHHMPRYSLSRVVVELEGGEEAQGEVATIRADVVLGVSYLLMTIWLSDDKLSGGTATTRSSNAIDLQMMRRASVFSAGRSPLTRYASKG